MESCRDFWEVPENYCTFIVHISCVDISREFQNSKEPFQRILKNSRAPKKCLRTQLLKKIAKFN